MNTLILLAFFTTSPLLTGYSFHAGVSEGGGDLYWFAMGSFGQFGAGFWRKFYSGATNPDFFFEFTSLNIGDTTDSGRSISYSMGFGVFADFKVVKFTPYVDFYLHFLPWENLGMTFTLHYAWGHMENRPRGFSFGAGITFFGQPKEYSLLKHRELEKKRLTLIADTLIARGLQKLKAKEIDSAEIYFKSALKVAPWHKKASDLLAEAHLRKGIQYYYMHMPDSALSEFSIAYQINPQIAYLSDWLKTTLRMKAEIHYREGEKYLADSNYAMAIKEFKKAFESDSTLPVDRDSLFAELYFKYGLKDMADGDYESAVKHFERSMSYDSTVVLAHKDSLIKAYVSTGIDMIASGKLEDGIMRLEHAIDLDPSLTDSLSGRLQAAYFDYAFSLSETDRPESHLMYAMGNFYSGDRGNTLKHLRKFYDRLNQTPEIGRPYIRDLLRLAQARDPLIRGAALSSIELVAKSYPNDVAKFIQKIAPFIDDADATCRYEAIMTISWIARADYKKVLPYLNALAKHLDDASSDVRFAVVSTLTSIARKDPQAVSPYLDRVQELTNDPDDYVKTAAGEFLEIMKSAAK